MDALHGRNHAELAEPRNICGIYVLCVLGARGQVLFFGMLAEDALVKVERLAIGAIADGMDTELRVVCDRDFRGLADVCEVFGVEAAAVGRAGREIGVWLQQPRATRAKGSVDLAVNGADRPASSRGADDGLVAGPSRNE